MSHCRFIITSEEEWCPYLVGCAKNENLFEDISPAINTDDMKGENVAHLSVRQVYTIIGNLHGFSHIFISMVVLPPGY